MDLLTRNLCNVLHRAAFFLLLLAVLSLPAQVSNAQVDGALQPDLSPTLSPNADSPSESAPPLATPASTSSAQLTAIEQLARLPQALTHGPVTAAIDETGTETLLLSVVLESEQPGTAFKSLLLENPLRLVVDVNGVSVAGTRVFELIGKGPDKHADKPYRVSSIRMGGHPDKIRVVYDILTAGVKPALSLQGEIQGARKSLKISLAAPDPEDIELASSEVTPEVKPEAVNPKAGKPAAGAVTPEEIATPVATQVAAPSPEEPKRASPTIKVLSARRSAQKALAQPTAIPTTTVEVPPTLSSIPPPPLAAVAASSLPSPSVSSNTLNGFTFTQLGAENLQVLKIHLNTRPSFTLSRKDETSYLLFLPGFKLENPRVGLAHFPPAEFLGLTMIKAAAVQDGVEVTIVVERRVKLATSSSENEILVRAVQ